MNQSITCVQVELPEWRLYLAHLQKRPESDPARVDQLLAEAIAGVKERYASSQIGEDPAVKAARAAYRKSGGDSSRYRPAYEALARRVLKSGNLPRILPFVDLSNALSLNCRIPCCVGALSAFTPPLLLRRGKADDEFVTMRGPFSGADKPLLCDATGPVGTPIVDAERVLVHADTEDVLYWAYVPAGLECDPASALRDALGRCGLAEVVSEGWSEAAL